MPACLQDETTIGKQSTLTSCPKKAKHFINSNLNSVETPHSPVSIAMFFNSMKIPWQPIKTQINKTQKGV